MTSGQLFDEKYRIITTLGKGGTSTVYLAQNIRLGTLWAIKQISKEKNKNMDIFIEPNILKRLNHPALPRIFDIVEDEENIYIVEDFVEGVPLDKELHRCKNFPEKRVAFWAKQICDVLNYLHNMTPSPIIFRDLKPSNIILTHEDKIKLIDFGIAREYKEGCIEDTVCMGTRGYCAPEIYTGLNQTDARADIYSFGVTMYSLISGNKPEELHSDMRAIKEETSGISKAMHYVIKKCTELDISKRFQTVNELEKYLSNLGENDIVGKNSTAITRETRKEEIPETVLLRENDSNIHNTNNIYTENQGEIAASINKPIVFKKLILAVIGNVEFATDIAYIVAKLTAFRVLLVNLDFNLDPGGFLDLSKKMNKAFYSGDEEVGLKPFLEFSKDYSYIPYETFERAAFLRNDTKSLHMIGECPCYENAENFKTLDVELFLEWAYKYYDLTVVLVNQSPFDTYAVEVSGKADYLIIPFKASPDKLNETKRYIEFMKSKHLISGERYKAVAFDYKRGTHMPENSIKQMLQSYIGSVEYVQQREELNSLGEVFCTFATKGFSDDYGRLLSDFNIILEKKYKKRWFLR